MYIRNIVKKVVTFICHPVITTYLFLHGTRNFYIAPFMKINDYRDLEIGSDFYFGKNSRFLLVYDMGGDIYTPHIKIGKHVMIGTNFSCLSGAPIVIGDDCLLSSSIMVVSENHGMNPEMADSYADTPLEVKPVYIGKGCWIGEKASIMPGVTLGDRCIVAANAVVTKSFPSYSLVGGVPAKLLKKYDFKTHSWIRIEDGKV